MCAFLIDLGPPADHSPPSSSLYSTNLPPPLTTRSGAAAEQWRCAFRAPVLLLAQDIADRKSLPPLPLFPFVSGILMWCCSLTTDSFLHLRLLLLWLSISTCSDLPGITVHPPRGGVEGGRWRKSYKSCHHHRRGVCWGDITQGCCTVHAPSAHTGEE